MTWLDRYFYQPSWAQKILAFLLLPLSFFYALGAILNSLSRRRVDFKKPVISVGNLSVGGEGKTPFCKAVAREFEGVFVVLRGYKRKSKGLVLVKCGGEILCDFEQGGDEAMEYAYEESVAGVIVSANRVLGVERAFEMGAKIVLLDDAFSKFHIVKLNLLLEGRPRPYFDFVLPSGAYRLPPFFAKRADFVAREGEDFYRYSATKENPKAVLVSAIAKPFRLHEHFIKARACYFFKDHYAFKKKELEALLARHHCDTLMLTFKDFVRVEKFGFKCQIIELHIELGEPLKRRLKNYVEGFENEAG